MPKRKSKRSVRTIAFFVGVVFLVVGLFWLSQYAESHQPVLAELHPGTLTGTWYDPRSDQLPAVGGQGVTFEHGDGWIAGWWATYDQTGRRTWYTFSDRYGVFDTCEAVLYGGHSLGGRHGSGEAWRQVERGKVCIGVQADGAIRFVGKIWSNRKLVETELMLVRWAL